MTSRPVEYDLVSRIFAKLHTTPPSLFLLELIRQQISYPFVKFISKSLEYITYETFFQRITQKCEFNFIAHISALNQAISTSIINDYYYY